MNTAAPTLDAPADYRSLEYGLVLHERMLVGDVTALEAIFSRFMAPLASGVRRKFPNYFDVAQYEAAAEEAIVSYWRKPERYSPKFRISLFAFLFMAAKRDFQNLLDKDARQLGEKHGYKVEPFVADDENESEREFVDITIASNDHRLILAETAVWDHIAAELPEARDQECAYLMLEGVRETHEYARIFGITDLPPKEQEHVVKKHKDRIKKQLQRHLVPEEYRLHD